MKIRIPALVLSLLYLCFLGHLLFSAPLLPDRVATHFNLQGQPDGWMSRSAHLVFMTAFGFGFPLILVGICYLIRYFPASCVNIPHRDYWLAPERRGQTCAYLFHHSLWLASLSVGFVIGLNFAVVEANRLPQPQLSNLLVLCLAGCFLVGVGSWTVSLIRHFRQVKVPSS